MKNKINKITITTFLLLLFIVISATYAYFVAQKGTGGSAQIEVGADTTDLLSFTNGDKINIVANQDNFKKGGESIVDKSTVTATLTPNNTTNIAHDTYNVYLIIENNDFEYTTSELKPELMLKVINPLGEEITEMKGFNYTLNQGFDITNKKRAAYPIVKGYEIDANGEAKVDEWQIEVTLVNLESDQNDNAGKTFTGSILITSKDLDTYDLAEIKNMISTTTYKSVSATLEYEEGTNTIDKYYYAITETDEEPIALSISEVADALSYSYHESEEATYEFTTTDDGEKLKPNQNYKVFSYAKDKEGYQSNIYETIVTTDNYEIPIINDVTYSVMPTSITLNVSATPKSAKIIKYQYKLNSEDEWHDFTETTYTINALDEATVYEIKVRAIDEEEMPSNPWEESITTGKYGSEEFPYEIKTVEDLVKLSNDVNSGKTFANEYFKLMNDIDFQNKDNYQNADAIVEKDINGNGVKETILTELTTVSGFKPIGKIHSNPFSGNFDGNSHSISSLYINITERESSAAHYVGLFGYGVNATINNLTVNGTVKTSITADEAGIIARLDAGNINNVHSNVNVFKSYNELGLNQTGGIIGYIGGNVKVTNSSNENSVANGGGVGGIIGTIGGPSNVTIENCQNKGNITDTYGHIGGGLVGNATSSTQLTIDSSENRGKILIDGTHDSISYAGGLVGYHAGKLTINSGKNYGEVNSNIENEINVRLGGLVGFNGKELTINNSFNKNIIKSQKLKYTQFYQIDLGGLVGLVSSSNVLINNSYNESDILNGTYVAGLIGHAIGGQIIVDKSYNKGSIDDSNIVNNSTSNVIGGLIGYTAGTSTTGNTILQRVSVLNSYNSGNVNALSLTAGLVGHANCRDNLYIINSYNTGSVTSASNYANGIAEFAYYGYNYKVNNVYNIGDIKGKLGNYGISWIDGATVIGYEVKNSYYKNVNKDNSAVLGSNYSGNLTSFTDSELKNQSFINQLNENIKGINLSSIDSMLAGYELVKWQKGSDGYPTFVS